MKIKLCISLVAFALIFSSCDKEKKKSSTKEKDTTTTPKIVEGGYKISGSLNNVSNLDTIFIYEDSVDKIEKILSYGIVKDNKFTVTGKIDTPEKAILGNVKKNIRGNIILENANYTVKINDKKIFIYGGKIHDKILGLLNNEEYANLSARYEKGLETTFDGVDMGNEKDLNKALKKVDSLENSVLDYESKVFTAILNDEEESTLNKMFTLVTHQDWNVYTTEKRLQLLDEYEKVLGEHKNIKIHREYLTKPNDGVDSEQNQKGEKVKYIELIGLDASGKEIPLSNIVKKNKYTLLNFWASWSKPSREEIKTLKKVYAKYKKLGLEIHSISLDFDKQQWEKALKEEQIKWSNSLLPKESVKEEIGFYGFNDVPATFLISQDGTIVATHKQFKESGVKRILRRFLR